MEIGETTRLMPKLENTVDELPMQYFSLGGWGGVGGDQLVLVSRVLTKEQGLKRLVALDLSTLCDGKRSILNNVHAQILCYRENVNNKEKRL